MNGKRAAARLGPKVARRRAELGLTVEELAARTPMSPEYLRHLEQNAAIVGAETVIRLARALRISGWALLGDDSAWHVQDVARAAESGELVDLSETECWRLISAGGVGRVITGVRAVPVNYALFQGDVVFWTADQGVLATLLGSEVGFEVDRVDDDGGWNVILIGQAIRVMHPALTARIRRLVQPWAGDGPPTCVRLSVRSISGRSAHAHRKQQG